MIKTNTVTKSLNGKKLIDTVPNNYVSISVNIAVTASTSDDIVHIMLYQDSIQKCLHDMTFSISKGQTIFIDSKIFVTSGNSLRFKSNSEYTVCTVMYDLSINS